MATTMGEAGGGMAQPASIQLPGPLLGVGMGGLVDGILLHPPVVAPPARVDSPMRWHEGPGRECWTARSRFEVPLTGGVQQHRPTILGHQTPPLPYEQRLALVNQWLGRNRHGHLRTRPMRTPKRVAPTLQQGPYGYTPCCSVAAGTVPRRQSTRPWLDS